MIVEEGPKTGGVGAEIAAGLVRAPARPPRDAGRFRRRAGSLLAAARERLPARRRADRRRGARPLPQRPVLSAPMAKAHVIAFDAGGTAVKAALYDERGAERAVAAVGMPPLHPAPGCLERDPEAMWAAVCDVARKVARRFGRRAVVDRRRRPDRLSATASFSSTATDGRSATPSSRPISGRRRSSRAGAPKGPKPAPSSSPSTRNSPASRCR